MIKARSGELLIFGLSARNIELLRQGHPIDIDLKDLGLKGGRVLILYGETERVITEELAKIANLPAGTRFQ